MAQIRACVAADLTYQEFLTWYADGTVERWWRDGDWQTMSGIDTLDDFNALLLECNVLPVGSGGKRQRRAEWVMF